MKIDTFVCLANSHWHVLTIKEEFRLCKLLLESAESVSLTWWRISLPNKLSGGIRILALGAHVEHLWSLATHLVCHFDEETSSSSQRTVVSAGVNDSANGPEKTVYFYECCQPPESQGWHTAISRGFVKKWEKRSKFTAAIQKLTSFPENPPWNIHFWGKGNPTVKITQTERVHSWFVLLVLLDILAKYLGKSFHLN